MRHMTTRQSRKSATSPAMNAVGIRDLRDHLSAYLERVKAGETITITEHGKPIARVLGSRFSPRVLELIANGTITPASRPMPDLRKIHTVQYPGDTQDLIDEIRG